MRIWLAALGRCLRAEALKLRRTPALALAVLLPVTPPLLFFVYALQRGNQAYPEGVSAVAWTIQGTLSLWASFLLPPFCAVETSLLAGTEHDHGGWKHLLALPVPRDAVYAAKFVTSGALMAIATLCLGGYTVLSVWGLTRVRREEGFVGSLWVQETICLVALIGAASVFLLSVHSYVALRWRSFAVNVGLAPAAVLGSLILVESRLWSVYPWSLPGAVHNLAVPLAFGWGTRAGPLHVAMTIAIALAGGALVVFLGAWRLSRRDVS